jgi:DNA/RNA endonuclease YhcR with UshA esterase domain
MRHRILTLLAIAAMGATALPSIAHHAFNAEFDRNKPITVTGTVTKVEWMNPHARFYVDVKQEDGKVVNWDFELGSPNILMRRGWSRFTLKEGDVVTVTGWAAKNASNVANSGTVTMNGKRLFAGSSNPEADQ